MAKRSTDIQRQALLNKAAEYGDKEFSLWVIQEEIPARRRMTTKQMGRNLGKYGYEKVKANVWRKKQG